MTPQLPLTHQDEAWGAVADPLAVTLQLGSSQHSDSASLSLFQILGRAPLSPAEVKRLSPGQSLRLVGRGPVVGAAPPGVRSGAQAPVRNVGREKGMSAFLRQTLF